ncbi:MAG: hypothetical protein KGQ51_15390 [Planctomycetes bacterium]|nr:hypothetical protein [Planctomycetota bacterium]
MNIHREVMRFLNILIWMLLGIAMSGQMLFAQEVSAESSAGDASAVGYDAVQSIFKQHCTSCHNEDQPRADLVLTSLDKILAGSASGPVVVPGDPQTSPLYLLSAHLESPKMPPNKPRLSQRELNKIFQWISTGLVIEAKGTMKPIAETPQPSSSAEMSNAPLKLTQLRPLSQNNIIRSVAVSPTSPTIAIAGNEQVLFWDGPAGQLQDSAIDVGSREISALCYSRDGTRLWIAAGIPAESGALHAWSVADSRYLASIGNESDTINTLDEDHVSGTLAMGTTRRLLKLFTKNESEERIFAKHTDWVTSTAFSPDGILVASGDRFGSIIAWDPVAGTEFSTLRGHTGMITSILWSKDSDELLSASLDGSMRVWDMHRSVATKSWIAHPQGVATTGFLANGDVVSFGKDGSIVAWSVPFGSDTEPVVQWKVSLGKEIISGSIGYEGRMLVATDVDGRIHVGMITNNEPNANGPELHVIALPNFVSKRSFTAVAPRNPTRVREAADVDQIATAPEAMTTAVAIKDSASNEIVASNEQIDSDIDETKRALESVQQALAQSYETTRQLEETAARLKQMLEIQEARIRQRELSRRQELSLPKNK